MTVAPKATWTIPVADGPVSAVADRAVATVVSAVAVGLTWKLSGVAPDPRGHGTHEQFGMDPCGWPEVYGIPCPTCGCTTAAAQVVHGDLVGAFVTQPFGAAVAVVGLLAGLHGLACLLRARSFVDALVRLPFWWICAGMFALFWAAWGYKYLVWEA
ncbi:MAG: DUF2752 domain-containing protein [Planctomycetota bacterium]|nr:DUF2752 domain-containing protein [Planctomycetota bacterium]